MKQRIARRIALVAHDNKKPELIRWAAFNRGTLSQHHLLATGTTGTLLEYELGLPVTRLLSGPVGGDQQIGARKVYGNYPYIHRALRLHLVSCRPIEPSRGTPV